MTQRRSFVGGAAILAVAGVLGKIVAAFYRVWLNALIGPEGLGIYQIPSNFYAFLLVVSSAGIPTAVSKLVSESLARGDEYGAKETFVAARRVLFFTGAITTVLMALLAEPLARAAGEPAASMGFIALAPSLLIVCMLSAYRGYFQGWQRMSPSAISQIVEQIGRLVFGFGLAVLWSPKGAAWSAAGAILGVTLCEAAALSFIYGSYRAHRRKDAIRVKAVRFRAIAVRIFKIAVPVTIGASIMPLVGLTDTMTVINRLTAAGFAAKEATETFGIFNGMIQSIINMPAVMTLALSISLVPAISEAITRKERAHAMRTARTGLKLAAMIGFPCAFGLSLLAGPIMYLLSPSYTSAQHETSAMLLGFMAFAVMFLSINQTTTGILQGYGRPLLPVVSLGSGAVVKVILNYTLIAIPDINIMGAAIGSIACYATAAVLNMIFVVRVSGMRFDFTNILLRPFLAAAGMALAVCGVQTLAGDALSRDMALFLCVGAGVAVYGLLAVLIGAVSRQEMSMLPGGRRLAGLMTRLRIYREAEE